MEVKFEVEIDGNSVVVITSRGDVEVERIFFKKKGVERYVELKK